MNLDVESVEWRIIYARHFFSRGRDTFDSNARFVLSRIVSGLLFLLYAVWLAAFVICFFGVVPFYIVLYFEDVAAPWAATPIIHGFRFYLFFATLAVIPMLAIARYAKKESTRRMMKDISSVYCAITIPLTMLELINIYPAHWSTLGGMVMDNTSWTLYFSAQMLDGIMLGHFTHFFEMPEFPEPDSLYAKTLLFLMKLYFAAASTWYFYHQMRFRLTGALEITLSPNELKSWLPRWAAMRGIDASTVRIRPVAVRTNIARLAKAISYEEMFGVKPAKPSKTPRAEAGREARGESYGPLIHEMPMAATAGIMSGGALIISLVSIPVVSQEWVDRGLIFLKYYAYVVALPIGAFFLVAIGSVVIKKWKSQRPAAQERDAPPRQDQE